MPKEGANAKSSEWGSHIDSCVTHWARTLAGSPDSPYVVADAAIYTCTDAMGWQAQALSREEPGLYPDVDATEKQLQADQRSEALVEVERFREARCKGPREPD